MQLLLSVGLNSRSVQRILRGKTAIVAFKVCSNHRSLFFYSNLKFTWDGSNRLWFPTMQTCLRNYSYKASLKYFTAEKSGDKGIHNFKSLPYQNLRRQKNVEKNLSESLQSINEEKADEGFDSKSNAFYFELERRTHHHIKVYSSFDKSRGNASWRQMSADLVMKWTKLWGRNRNVIKISNKQLYRGVYLAHVLMTNVLDDIKNELEKIWLVSLQNSEEKGKSPALSLSPLDFNKKESKKFDTETCCHMVVLGWSRCDPKLVLDAGINSQSVFDRLEELCDMFDRLSDTDKQKVSIKRAEITPTTILCNHILNCWSRSSDQNAEKSARDLLARMSSKCGRFSRPDTISYNSLLKLYAYRGDVKKAEALLEEMENSNHEVVATNYSYSIFMNALQRRFLSSGSNRDMNDPVYAEKVLMKMITMYENSGFTNNSIMPTEVCYGVVLSLYAAADRRPSGKVKENKLLKCNNNEPNLGWGAKNAERVLNWIIDLYERGVQDDVNKVSNNSRRIQLNSQHFLTVMDAWTKASKGIKSAEHCEQLCNRLVSLYHKSGGDTNLRPRPQCFGVVIDAWSKADHEHATAEHAEAILKKMEDLFLHDLDSEFMLSNVAYNLVIDAWSRRSGNDATERAENVFQRMVTNYKLTDNHLLRPDVISYTALMKSYVKRPDGGTKALRLLQEMRDQNESGNHSAKPDIQAITIAMDACAKSGMLQEALGLLNEVNDSEKTEVMFNTILTAYKLKGLGEEAEALLTKMVDLANAGNKRCAPDSLSYMLCIDAWRIDLSQDRLLRARVLFEQSIQSYLSGKIGLKPTTGAFNGVANIIALSDDPEKEFVVLQLFQEMEKLGCEPNINSFNILIKACATVKGSAERKKNSLKIAVNAFDSINSLGLRADSVTYFGIMKAFVNLTEGSVEKTTPLQFIFQQCCEKGCLSQEIMNVLIESSSQDEFSRITGLSLNEKKPQLLNLPLQWSRHNSFHSAKGFQI